MSDEFDIEAGVDAIASDMGWESNEETTYEIDDVINDDEVLTDELQEETETTEEVETEVKRAPASWSKDQHENWAKVPPEAQQYIELREKQMLDGIEQYKQGHAYAQELQRVIEPYKDMLQHFGASESQVLENTLGWNRSLTSGDLESRQQAFIKLGTDLGLIPQEGQQPIDPRTQELQQRLDRIERQEQQRAQQTYQQNYQKVASEVETFANDPKNEHFEEVADDVILLLKTGIDLQAAYDKAVWANPITRAKEQSKLIESKTKELAGKKNIEAKAAIKAKSGNVRGVSSTKETAEPVGTWEQTMREVIENRRDN